MPNPRNHYTKVPSGLSYAILAGLIVFLAALFGILTRPVGYLAAFWPANAIVVAMMVRWPKFCTILGWLAVTLGMLAADLLTGNDIVTTAWLTAANLVGASVGTALYYTLSPEDRKLMRPASMLQLLAISTVASFASAIVGGGNEMLAREEGWVHGYAFCFVGEFVNHLLLQPVILTTPAIYELKKEFLSVIQRHLESISSFLPILSLLGSVVLLIQIGGPGAIAFVVPSLLWCSITYRRFTTAIITLMALAFILIADSTGWMRMSPSSQSLTDHTISLRLGVALIALVPVMSSSIYETRQQVIQQLSHSLQFDYLTETLSRKFFLEQAASQAQIRGPKETVDHVYCLMIDIDHFKKINDTFGHAAGDMVLKEFARRVKGQLRRSDLFGRMGGEEFSIILFDTPAHAALDIAERIRETVANAPVQLPVGRLVSMSVSIGIAKIDPTAITNLEQTFSEADYALYEAKEGGRNRIRVSWQEEDLQGSSSVEPKTHDASSHRGS